MSHGLAALNSSALVMFGGNGDGAYLNDLVVGTPNRDARHVPTPAQRAVDNAPDVAAEVEQADCPSTVREGNGVVRTVRTAHLGSRKK